MRDVRRTSGGRGLRGGPGKIVGVISSGRPHNIWYRYRPMGKWSPGRGGMAQDGETRGGTFHG